MGKPLSPIERMIDAATGYKPEENDWPKPRPTDMHDKQVALGISQSAIGHITQMYPGMFVGVPQTARISLGNHIYNEVLHELGYYTANPTGQTVPNETARKD